MMIASATSVHRLRITLDHVEPPIWRLLEVESDWPLDFVSSAIRAAFGWSGDHACKFTIKRQDYGTHNNWARFDPDQEFDKRQRQIRKGKPGPVQYQRAMRELFAWYDSVSKPDEDDEDTIPSLGELVRRAGAKFLFVFDFGDWWKHTICVEKISPVSPEAVYPRCLDGAGANPLEDCGGAWNLMAVFDAVKHPERPRNETVKHIVEEWVGEGWDFSHFSVDEANQRLRHRFPTKA
ncbi:MAG TPA: plasmid pRiA4b ORF-3 family protein [Candidatus Acidoferrales bacterium]|nr:plasmid pRiA4b ORF-3 family protein [Candidatus Acidoferrales bacterium]